MGNAIMSFGEFHLALTGLANHTKIGVVPVLRDNTPGFGAIDEPHTGMPSPVRIDFRRGHFKGFDSRGLAWIHDDTAFYDDIGFLDKILKTRMGEMLPDDVFFGRPVTEAQAQRRDRIKSQVTQGHILPDEPAGPSVFSEMTVEVVAKRLGTKSYLEGGGNGHADLADALLTRGYALGVDNVMEPTGHLFAASVLLANMRAPWALQLAESSFAAAALESLQHRRPRDVAAAILYGFGADMRDARVGGLEPNNPMRANAARTWLGSIERAKSGVDIGARVLFGMSEAFRAGDFDTYRQFADTYVSTLLRHESVPLLEVAGYAVRLSWAQAEQVADGTLSEDRSFWSGADDDLQLASRYFRVKGEGELAGAAGELSKVAHEKGHSGT